MVFKYLFCIICIFFLVCERTICPWRTAVNQNWSQCNFVEHELVLSIHLGFSIENWIKKSWTSFLSSGVNTRYGSQKKKKQLLVQKYTQVLNAVRPRNSGTTNIQISTGQVPWTASFGKISTLWLGWINFYFPWAVVKLQELHSVLEALYYYEKIKSECAVSSVNTVKSQFGSLGGSQVKTL
jgi:hypothetical protein